jgi:hypothetical protein
VSNHVRLVPGTLYCHFTGRPLRLRSVGGTVTDCYVSVDGSGQGFAHPVGHLDQQFPYDTRYISDLCIAFTTPEMRLPEGF